MTVAAEAVLEGDVDERIAGAYPLERGEQTQAETVAAHRLATGAAEGAAQLERAHPDVTCERAQGRRRRRRRYDTGPYVLDRVRDAPSFFGLPVAHRSHGR